VLQGLNMIGWLAAARTLAFGQGQRRGGAAPWLMASGADLMPALGWGGWGQHVPSRAHIPALPQEADVISTQPKVRSHYKVFGD